MSNTLAANEVVVTAGLENAKPFWTGISTVPNVTNERGDLLYTGTFSVIDNTSSASYDGFCQLNMTQRTELAGISSPQYLALRETGYALPLFKTSNANVYEPISVVFDWSGDIDSQAEFLIYSKKNPTSKYIKIVFAETVAYLTINGIDQTIPSIASFFTDDRVIRKVTLAVLTQTTSKTALNTIANIEGRIQLVLTDFQTGINRVLWDNVINADPSDLYQFEARLIHS